MAEPAAPLIEMYTRQGDIWSYRVLSGLDVALELSEIGVTIPPATIYANTDLTA